MRRASCPREGRIECRPVWPLSRVQGCPRKLGGGVRREEGEGEGELAGLGDSEEPVGQRQTSQQPLHLVLLLMLWLCVGCTETMRVEQRRGRLFVYLCELTWGWEGSEVGRNIVRASSVGG